MSKTILVLSVIEMILVTGCIGNGNNAKNNANGDDDDNGDIEDRVGGVSVLGNKDGWCVPGTVITIHDTNFTERVQRV